MKFSLRIRALVAAMLLAGTLSAQHLVFSRNPLPLGATVAITVVNSGTTPFMTSNHVIT